MLFVFFVVRSGLFTTKGAKDTKKSAGGNFVLFVCFVLSSGVYFTTKGAKDTKKNAGGNFVRFVCFVVSFLKDEAFDAGFQLWNVEVDQQARFDSG